MTRSTRQVFDDHLAMRSEGRLEDDLTHNFADDVVLLCEFGVLHGHDGIRGSAHRLRRQYPGMNYEYLAREVEAEYAFLKWRATAPDGRTTLGADSFVVRNGKIIMQTVYYQDGKPNQHEKPTR